MRAQSMALTNAEKSARKRERKAMGGLVRLPDYATREQRDLIVEYLAGRAEIVKLSKESLHRDSE